MARRAEKGEPVNSDGSAEERPGSAIEESHVYKAPVVAPPLLDVQDADLPSRTL